MLTSLSTTLLISAAAAVSATPFVHPGVFVSASQLEYIKQQVSSQTENDVKTAHFKALKSKFADLSYKPRGPPASGVVECGSYSHPDHGCSDENSDSAVAYMQALLFAIGGEPQRATIAASVLDSYANRLLKYNNSNAPLQAAWSDMYFTKAAELLAHTNSGWGKAQQRALGTVYYCSCSCSYCCSC